jgi:Effector-associated domain 11
MNAKSTLAQWLADGDLDRTLRGLEWLQSRHHPALNTELVLQKSRFQSLQNDRDRGIVAEELGQPEKSPKNIRQTSR